MDDKKKHRSDDDWLMSGLFALIVIMGVVFLAAVLILLWGAASAIAQPPEHLDPYGAEQLRVCESENRYDVVSPDGRYHGAYQFAPDTWDSTMGWLAEDYGHELQAFIGVAPSDAPPWVQDLAAKELWERDGSQHWPVCQYNVTAAATEEEAPIPGFAGFVTLWKAIPYD